MRVILFLAAIFATVYFGLYSYFDPPFRISSTFRGPSDRYLHIAALACMTFIIMIGQKKQLAWLLAMAVFAVALELAQIWLPARVASSNDLFASLAGVALGGIFAVVSNRFLHRLNAAPTIQS